MILHQGHEIELALAMNGRREGIERHSETLQQCVGEVPLGFRQALHRTGCATIALSASAGERCTDARDAERRRGPAQHADLKHAGRMFNGFT